MPKHRCLTQLVRQQAIAGDVTLGSGSDVIDRLVVVIKRQLLSKESERTSQFSCVTPRLRDPTRQTTAMVKGAESASSVFSSLFSPLSRFSSIVSALAPYFSRWFFILKIKFKLFFFCFWMTPKLFACIWQSKIRSHEFFKMPELLPTLIRFFCIFASMLCL